jgi:uncharacterized membrane protein
MQAICLGGLSFVLWIVYAVLIAGAIASAGAGGAGIFGILSILFWLLWLGIFVLWIICLIMAFTGKWFKIPVIGDLAWKWAGV